jgi:urease accessory protein
MRPWAYFTYLTNDQTNAFTDDAGALHLLKLMQLADSALPIGSAAHSFGLETLVAEERLTVDALPEFLRDYLAETGTVDAAFCRAAYRLAGADDELTAQWFTLTQQVSARKPAQESRTASLTLGRRMMRLFLALENARDPGVEAHYSMAFGYVGGILEVSELLTVAAYLQQTTAGLVSACQRLLPLGQQHAARLLWELKPAILEIALVADLPADAQSFTPMVDMASMRHVELRTRLFVS